MELNITNPGEYKILTGNSPVKQVTPKFTAIRCTPESVLSFMSAYPGDDYGSGCVCVFNPEELAAYAYADIRNDRAPCIKAMREINEDVAGLRLNGAGWNNQELSRYIRFNRHLFYEADVNTLVNSLSDFRAEVQKQIESMKSDDGTTAKGSLKRDIFVTNKPEPFTVRAPLYIGTDPEMLNVTVRYEENRDGGGVLLYLECESYNSVRNKASAEMEIILRNRADDTAYLFLVSTTEPDWSLPGYAFQK